MRSPTPVRPLSCDIASVIATPAIYPMSTGLDSRLASTPNRRTRAMRQPTPTVSAMLVAPSRRASGVVSAMPVSVAAIRVQVAVSGPTMRVRDEPKNAYASMPAMAAHRPATGGTPIMAE